MHAAVQGRPRVSVSFQSLGECFRVGPGDELLDNSLRPINKVQEVAAASADTIH